MKRKKVFTKEELVARMADIVERFDIQSKALGAMAKEANELLQDVKNMEGKTLVSSEILKRFEKLNNKSTIGEVAKVYLEQEILLSRLSKGKRPLKKETIENYERLMNNLPELLKLPITTSEKDFFKKFDKLTAKANPNTRSNTLTAFKNVLELKNTIF